MDLPLAYKYKQSVFFFGNFWYPYVYKLLPQNWNTLIDVKSLSLTNNRVAKLEEGRLSLQEDLEKEKQRSKQEKAEKDQV